MQKVHKHLVATQLLEQAIRLYLEGSFYFSALHLAGAAEEILAVYLDKIDIKSAFDREKDLSMVLEKIDQNYIPITSDKSFYNYVNDPKNSVKHKKGHKDNYFEYDAEFEAKEVIDRAITNYYLLIPILGLRETELIIAYRTHRGC